MAATTHDGRKKHRIRDFKGLIPAGERRRRIVTFGILVIVMTSMTFVQFGFLGVGADGLYITYVLGILAPIAIGALLMGRSWGTLTGLAGGVIQYVHATLQPLDIYEKYFVSWYTVIPLYVMAGFVLGFAFQIALRNEPQGARRHIYMSIVSLVSSFLTSAFFLMLFLLRVIVALASVALDSGVEDMYTIDPSMLQAMTGVGKLDLQILMDAVLILVVCVILDKLYTNAAARHESQTLRAIFRRRLAMVVVLAFMVVSSMSFMATTMQAELAAKTRMDNEIEFLLSQIGLRGYIDQQTADLGAAGELSPELQSLLQESSGISTLLSGYKLDYDGTIVVFKEENNDLIVELSDNPMYVEGESIDYTLGFGGLAIIKQLAEENRMWQTTYDVKSWRQDMEEDLADDDSRITQIGYMCVGSVQDRYVMMELPASMVFADRAVTMTWVTIVTLVMLVVVYAAIWKALDSFVTRPIDETNSSLAKVTSGNLDEKVEVRESIEFSSLSDGINTTVGALKGWIKEAEDRMERDLSTAKAIQISALPRTFPPFPEIEAFDIFASMNAAKEVGGDFYDFFLIDDHTLGFLIADVSGKGIPGALFMMAAKAELQNYIKTGMDLSQAVTGANQYLCANNDAGMFVTVWAATLDWLTGEVTYVNAGHNFPLLRHGQGGQWEWLTKKCGLFLGTFETAKYRKATFTLQPGDELILYTDGVNEAFNVDEEEYSNERLEAFLAAHCEQHPRTLINELLGDVRLWAEGAEQSDDITMLCLEYGVAPEATGTITVPAVLENLDKAQGIIDTELLKRLCPPVVRNKLDVAFEELFVNVCHYAYADKDEPGEVRVSYVYTGDPSSMTVEIVDDGIPFDPITREDPILPSNIQEAKIGGLGIMMVKRCVDDISYIRDGASNVIAFTVSW